MSEDIVIKGARLNNLKNINLSIPRNKFVVITGVSGSGKSTLAFDTIFAEGQRRYVESLSSFARQFLGRVSKPDVDEISGIPPAIAIEQRVSSSNSRSTVGSVSEISHYLRLLYAKIGESYSPISGERVERDSTTDIVKFILSQKSEEVIYILAPIEWDRAKRVERALFLREQGYSRLWYEGKLFQIEELFSNTLQSAEELFKSPPYLLIDRVFSNDNQDNRERILDSINVALTLDAAGERERESLYVAYKKEGEYQLKRFSTLFERDGILFEEPTQELFNSNNPLGACPTCSGYGLEIGIDPHKVIPEPSTSLYQECVACWRGESMSYYQKEFIAAAPSLNFPIHRPYNELSEAERTLLWQGTQDVVGIESFFKILEENKYKIQNRYMISRFSGKRVCSTCNGKRLRKEALYVKLGGEDIASLFEMSLEKLYNFITTLTLTPYQERLADRVVKEIEVRLRRMIEIGLGYLTLNRSSKTLSGGESQRLNLAGSLGSNLTGSLYILDEPSVGLHSKDSSNLIKILKELRDMGNSLLVVEHDEEIMRASDLIIDIGPLAGSWGGEITFIGSPNHKLEEGESSKSITLQYLSGLKSIPMPPGRREWSDYISVEGATHHNL
ncbi:MAG: excinuclease ABC subunit A, partial [Bacteroidales bacterium]